MTNRVNRPESPDDVVIVSAVRTAVARGKKDGALASTHPVELSALVMKEALDRAGVDPAIVDDVAWGCAMPEASQGLNVARLSALRAGLPVEVPAQTVNRFCSSGLQTIADGAMQIMSGMSDVVLAGGVEMMSQVPMSGYHARLDPEALESYIGMGFTAERVAERWKISRADQDAWALGSQQKAAKAMAAGAFDDQIVPVPVERVTWDGTEKQVEHRGVRARRAGARRDDRRGTRQAQARVQDERHRDRGQREPVLRRRRRRAADAPLEGGGARPRAPRTVRQLRRRRRRSRRHGRRADQGGAEGAEEGRPRDEGHRPHRVQRGVRRAGAGCHARARTCRQDRVNVNGGAIALGHPLGATGAKLTTQLVHELRRRGGGTGS